MDNPHSNKSYDVQMMQDSVSHMQGNGDTQLVFKYLVSIIMTQMSAKAGTKKHGKEAVTALFNIFLQLDDKTVFEGVMVATLSRIKKRRALRAINLIKEKRSGKLKGRTVADGSVQRDLYTKEETVSSTISNDALMLTILVDAWENRVQQ